MQASWRCPFVARGPTPGNGAPPHPSRERGQAVNGRVEDVSDGARALPGAGDDDQVQLDELPTLLLEHRPDAAPGGQRLADAGATEVADDAAHVDPWSEPHVLPERPVGLVEEERRVDPAVTAAVER